MKKVDNHAKTEENKNRGSLLTPRAKTSALHQKSKQKTSPVPISMADAKRIRA